MDFHDVKPSLKLKRELKKKVLEQEYIHRKKKWNVYTDEST